MRDLSLADLAAKVCAALEAHDIDAVLTGGAVVSIACARDSALDAAMGSIGFTRGKGERYYQHPDTRFFVEFPDSSIVIGR